MILTLLALAVAGATPAYDPTTPEAVFTSTETYTLDGSAKLWWRIERHRDPQPALFGPQDFSAGTEWPAASRFAPYIRECFGTGRPDAGAFLLHVGVNGPTATGTPILFVPGAGDNASRGFVSMAGAADLAGRPAFGLTFSHPHGDVFEQAEVIADAIARIKHLTGAAQVDLVSHSKGGIAAAVYLSNLPSTPWTDSAYVTHGTRYDGSVRRAVFIGVPLDGIDTAYRWPATNYAGLTADTAIAPTSWDDFYPLTTGQPWSVVGLDDQDFFPAGGDVFPGQRQLLKRQAPPLPGASPWLGTYALVQQDWYTTWHGGFGFVSYSQGIDDAVDAGGRLIDAVAARGVHPDVEVHVLAGRNPLLPNGTSLLLADVFGEVWVDLATAPPAFWGTLVGEVATYAIPGLTVEPEEVGALASGQLVLGEISGPSDGLVFVDSATAVGNLTARGATVVETRVADLSHLDLLYASPANGARMLAEAAADPVVSGWKAPLGHRYQAEDTIGWVLDALADPLPVDTGDTGLGGSGGATGTVSCAQVPGGRALGVLGIGLLVGLTRRRR